MGSRVFSRGRCGERGCPLLATPLGVLPPAGRGWRGVPAGAGGLRWRVACATEREVGHRAAMVWRVILSVAVRRTPRAAGHTAGQAVGLLGQLPCGPAAAPRAVAWRGAG